MSVEHTFLAFTSEDIQNLLIACNTNPPHFKTTNTKHLNHSAELFSISLSDDCNIVIQGCMVTSTNGINNHSKTTRYINTTLGMLNLDGSTQLLPEPVGVDGVTVHSYMDTFITQGKPGDKLLFRKLSAGKGVDVTRELNGRQYKLSFQDDIVIGTLIN